MADISTASVWSFMEKARTLSLLTSLMVSLLEMLQSFTRWTRRKSIATAQMIRHGTSNDKDVIQWT